MTTRNDYITELPWWGVSAAFEVI